MNDLKTINIEMPPKRVININIREAILAIEAKIKSMPESLGEDPFPLKHSFADGLYIREVFLPKGHFIVGKLHRGSYYNSMLSGDISVLTEEGVKRVKGPSSLISPPATKRFGYTHTDCIWVTVHANPDNITDIKTLESRIHAEEYNMIPGDVIECEPLNYFIGEISKPKFNAEQFRELTKEIYSHEKPGFWSDWTEEQQGLYASGDWEAFSISRGYTDEEINNLRLWINMLEAGEEQGCKPLEIIRDLSIAQSIKNLELDKNGEILKSSHIPTSRKQPYIIKGEDICLV